MLHKHWENLKNLQSNYSETVRPDEFPWNFNVHVLSLKPGNSWNQQDHFSSFATYLLSMFHRSIKLQRSRPSHISPPASQSCHVAPWALCPIVAHWLVAFWGERDSSTVKIEVKNSQGIKTRKHGPFHCLFALNCTCWIMKLMMILTRKLSNVRTCHRNSNKTRLSTQQCHEGILTCFLGWIFGRETTCASCIICNNPKRSILSYLSNTTTSLKPFGFWDKMRWCHMYTPIYIHTHP